MAVDGAKKLQEAPSTAVNSAKRTQEALSTAQSVLFLKKNLLIYLFLLEKYYICSVFTNNKNKMKALYDTFFFFFYYFYFSNEVKREFVCVR